MTGALARSPAAPLLVRRESASAAIDPLVLLRALPAAWRFYWEQPSRGFAVAAIGETLAVTASGRDRFGRIATGVRDALAGAPGAMAVGGFAFADDGDDAAGWRGFPAADWAIPQVAVVRSAGQAQLVATGLAGASAATLDALLERTRVALASPPPLADVAPAYHALGSSPASWRRAVEATLDDIAAGRLAKLVLARTCSIRAAAPFDATRVVSRLRAAYPGCTIFAVGRGNATFVGASPERLVRVRADCVETAAVAGTAARGADPRADRALARALTANRKERAEHALVVDDLRTRLQGSCDQVHVPAAPRVLATESVQHLHTPMRARLRPGATLLDAVAALHPTPAVCGAPRDAARRVLRGRERIARGWYAGGVGWIDGSGDGEVTVALRTALLRGTHAVLHAGAGIVAGSTWDAELEETRLKMRPLLAALLEL